MLHIVETGGVMRMSELKDVRRRIKARRYDEPERHTHGFHFFYHLMMLVMGIGVLGLAYLVNGKLGLVELPQDLQHINFGMVSEWLPFEDWFSDHDDTTVGAQPTYTLLKDNHYANGSNQASLLMDGVVLHVEQGDAKKGSVSVRHDNGVIATYGNLTTIQVKQDERLKRGDIAGTFDEYVSISLVKNNQNIDLNSALAQ